MAPGEPRDHKIYGNDSENSIKKGSNITFGINLPEYLFPYSTVSLSKYMIKSVLLVFIAVLYAVGAGYTVVRTEFLIVGPFWPTLMLLPVAAALVICRASLFEISCAFGLGLIACEYGFHLGFRGPDYLTPFWGAVVSMAFNLPLILLIAIRTNVLSTRRRRLAPAETRSSDS